MTPDNLVTIMAAAVVVSAVALVAQALLVFGMYRAMRTLKDQVSEFLPRAQVFLESAEKALVENQQQIREVTEKASSVLDVTQKQLVRVDEFVGEATGRAKVQMERLELILDDTIGRVHDTVMQLNQTVLRPVREIAGLASGVRAAIQHLLRGGRPNVAQATSDEEMFI